jgi:uncharacterized protein (TIGR02217 family)
MGYWLARSSEGQEHTSLMRFNPAYWTINFPRPVMASVVTTGPKAMRVDASFYGSGDLIGLIWDSEDRFDHPLLAYQTSRDYSHCTLRFHWRSNGIRALNAVNGPTLTIEGRRQDGNPHTWYVRLWNYASGNGQDAEITLDFANLRGGFLLPQEADPVWPADIDRMFISLVPAGYDGLGTPFTSVQEGWAEISNIRCEGSGAVLSVGDVMMPEHGLSMATGYDDSYNQTPERMLRQILGLGYRGDINHYVGMSHYFRLEPNSGGHYVSLAGGALNTPCISWHRDFAARAKALGFGVIWSLSYELLNAHCWNDWKQRAENGDPALTGWEPPSALLSPAHGGAMNYLQSVARAFIALAVQAGLSPQFQVGEPWWWVMDDGRICLYDDAAKAAFGGSPVSILTVRAPLNAAQKALLDQAGVLLANSTAALCNAVRLDAPATKRHLLVFLPAVLDMAAPEAHRANLPSLWAKPAFDVLQIEDYDWVTSGRGGLTAGALERVRAQLGYPVHEQQYFAGFVLNPSSAEQQWPLIAKAAEEAQARGTSATFLWALPQIARDGFTAFRIEGDDAVQPFDDELFPISIGREASVSPAFSTQIVESLSGHEQRSSDWADARLRFDAGPGVRSEEDLARLIAFFRARRGSARGFRFTDPFDHHSGASNAQPGPLDQMIGTGDGNQTRFQLCKYYGVDVDAQHRIITHPVAGSIRIALNGVEQINGWVHEGKGVIAFDTPPANGVPVRAGFRFDVPVRFAEDALEISRATFAAGEIPSVPLLEIRQ